MIKKDVDRLWNSIPIDLRDKIKNDFSVISKAPGAYDMGQTSILIEYFGKHNLESVFNVGDEVTFKGKSVVRTIMGISKDGRYVLNGKGDAFEANELELFNGFNIGNKVRDKYNPNLIGIIIEPKSGDDPNNYRVNWFDGDGGWDEEVSEKDIIKY